MIDDYEKMNELVHYIQTKYPDRIYSAMKEYRAGADKLELELGVKLPQAYKKMVNKYGTLGIMGSEFLGIPDNPKLTLAYRENADFPIPKSWVVIYQVGDGSVFCIETAIKISGDNPIVFWAFGEENTERLGSRSFADFVVETIWKDLLDNGYDVSEIKHLEPENPGSWSNSVVCNSSNHS